MHMVRCSRPGGVSALLTTQMLRIRVLGRSAFQFSLPPSSRMRTHVPQKYSVSRGSRKIDMYKFSAGSSCMQFEAHDTPDRVGTKKLCIWTRNSISLSFAHVVYQLRCFFFTPNLRNNGGNPNHNTSWSLNPGLKSCLIMCYCFVNFEWKCKAFFGANGLWNLRSKNRPFNPLARNEPRLNGSTVNEFYAKKVLDLPISSVGIKWNVSQPCKPTSKIVCCNEILQTGLAQFLCLFPCIYVFQVWRQVMCIVLQTKWSELIEPTTTPSMAHWGKGRTWTLLHGKFAIWKSRSNCIAQGQQANERIRIVVHCGGGQTGNHMGGIFCKRIMHQCVGKCLNVRWGVALDLKQRVRPRYVGPTLIWSARVQVEISNSHVQQLHVL